MDIRTLLAIGVVGAQSVAAQAANNAVRLNCATAHSIRTEAEVEAVPSQGIYTVNVTFIGQAPPSKEVDRILRDCVAVAVKRDGSRDIPGSAWLRKRPPDNPNDDDLLHPYGGLRFLSYTAKTN